MERLIRKFVYVTEYAVALYASVASRGKRDFSLLRSVQ